MTYNFDPERWYDIERRDLERRRAAGRLTSADFETAMTDLQDRYESMMDGLNSVADFPGTAPSPEKSGHEKPDRR